jgi:hypothetical protein
MSPVLAGLCSESSRSYPGRSVRHAVRILTAPDAATYRVIGQPPSPCGLWRAKEVSKDLGTPFTFPYLQF